MLSICPVGGKYRRCQALRRVLTPPARCRFPDFTGFSAGLPAYLCHISAVLNQNHPNNPTIGRWLRRCWRAIQGAIAVTARIRPASSPDRLQFTVAADNDAMRRRHSALAFMGRKQTAAFARRHGLNRQSDRRQTVRFSAPITREPHRSRDKH
jgi:hypothetical protein